MNTPAIVGLVLGSAVLAYGIYSKFGYNSSTLESRNTGPVQYEGDYEGVELRDYPGGPSYGTGGKKKKTKKSKHRKTKRTAKK